MKPQVGKDSIVWPISKCVQLDINETLSKVKLSTLNIGKLHSAKAE